MNQRKDLLSIGIFADMTRLSIKALRLYDQLDLLQPRHVDPQRVLSVTHHVKVDKLDAVLHEALDLLFGLVSKQEEKPAGDPFGIYHGAINEQEDSPVEVCLPVGMKIQAEGGMTVKQLEGGRAASVLMTGAQCDFPAILAGYDATADWIQKNGYQMAEPPAGDLVPRTGTGCEDGDRLVVQVGYDRKEGPTMAGPFFLYFNTLATFRPPRRSLYVDVMA